MYRERIKEMTAAICKIINVTSCSASQISSMKVFGGLGGMELQPNTCLRSSSSESVPDNPTMTKRNRERKKKLINKIKKKLKKIVRLAVPNKSFALLFKTKSHVSHVQLNGKYMSKRKGRVISATMTNCETNQSGRQHF